MRKYKCYKILEAFGMKTEKLFHDLLGLGMNWEVLECEFEKTEGIVRIRVGRRRILRE